MLHYKVILHVPVFLILYYVLLYNKIVLKMSLSIPQDGELHSGRIQGLSNSPQQKTRADYENEVPRDLFWQ